MTKEEKEYYDPSNWEYDGGSPNWTGDPENLSPYMKELSDKLTREAFPDGKEAFQKERAGKK